MNSLQRCIGLARLTPKAGGGVLPEIARPDRCPPAKNFAVLTRTTMIVVKMTLVIGDRVHRWRNIRAAATILSNLLPRSPRTSSLTRKEREVLSKRKLFRCFPDYRENSERAC